MAATGVVGTVVLTDVDTALLAVGPAAGPVTDGTDATGHVTIISWLARTSTSVLW